MDNSLWCSLSAEVIQLTLHAMYILMSKPVLHNTNSIVSQLLTYITKFYILLLYQLKTDLIEAQTNKLLKV